MTALSGAEEAAGHLARYLRTVGLLGAAAAAVVIGEGLAAPTTWLAAAAGSACWTVVAIAWLARTRRLGRVAVHLCTWGAPAAVLLPLAAPGWLTPNGLGLWWPLSTVLAVALAITGRP